MTLTIGNLIALAGFCLTACVVAGGIIYRWGRVNATNDKHGSDLDEIFTRLRSMEGITPRLQDAVTRLEKVLSNGIVSKIQSVEDRLARIETHCIDMHAHPPARQHAGASHP